MQSADDSFATQLERARQGDRYALDRMLSLLEQRFRTDAERRVGSALRGRTRVSDILQDAYVEVVRAMPRFQGSSETEFHAWVTTIIENTARRHHRHLTAQKRKPPSRTTEWNALTRAVMRTVSSPLSDLQKAEDFDAILNALQDLRDDHRIVLDQVVLLGRPIEEVAAELGRTEQATRMLLSRARAALTVRLDHLHRRGDGS